MAQTQYINLPQILEKLDIDGKTLLLQTPKKLVN